MVLGVFKKKNLINKPVLGLRRCGLRRFVLNLSDNKVRYLAPVKELFCLKHVKLEGNPVFQSEEEMDYLEGLLFLRNFERSGLMQDPGESFLEIILLISMV